MSSEEDEDFIYYEEDEDDDDDSSSYSSSSTDLPPRYRNPNPFRLSVWTPLAAGETPNSYWDTLLERLNGSRRLHTILVDSRDWISTTTRARSLDGEIIVPYHRCMGPRETYYGLGDLEPVWVDTTMANEDFVPVKELGEDLWLLHVHQCYFL